MSGPADFDGILDPPDPANFTRYDLENGISWDVDVYVPSEQDKVNCAETMAWLRANQVEFRRSISIIEFVVPDQDTTYVTREQAPG